MLLTNYLETIEGVNNVQVMMGTPANKDIFETSGLATKELAAATPNDMVIVVDVAQQDMIEVVNQKVKAYLEKQGQEKTNAVDEHAKTWDKALQLGKDAPLALISVPGIYAANEVERALDEDKHVFCFSDNVSLEDEARLKQKAHAKGLLLMGPDCGTGVANGIPLAFANRTRKGKIGIVGASGTGIQEVATIIHQLGEGVTNAIGTGGRDLKAQVGGITFKDSVALLDQDDNVQVIVAISKPPAKEVRNEIMDQLRAAHKPVVAIFLGERPVEHEEGFYQAYTLEETARIAVDLVNGKQLEPVLDALQLDQIKLKPKQTNIKGYYSGGTLAYEAATLINDTLNLHSKDNGDGFILKKDGHEVIDLGDDIYTQGRPHPMIDATKRKEMMVEAGNDPNTGAVLIDVVLGYGTHKNMAQELHGTIQKVINDAKMQGRTLPVIASIVGTKLDPQDYTEQYDILRDAGAIICDSNAQAVKTALALIKHPAEKIDKPILPKKVTQTAMPKTTEKLRKVLTVSNFINVGLKSFADAIEENNGVAVQFDWQPPAGGNIELQRALNFLKTISLSGEV